MRSPRKFDHARAVAESPCPIMPVHPKGVPGKWDGRINFEEVRQLRDAVLRTPPPRSPSPLPPLFLPSPPRKKDPNDILFIKRKPSVNASPLKDSSGRMRKVSSPYPSSSPSRPGPSHRVISGPGPAPEVYYTIVPQAPVFPPGKGAHDCPIYPADNNVILGSYPESGCSVTMPDAVNKGPLNIQSMRIIVAFQWKGYEMLGPFMIRVHLPDFRTNPFGARWKIITMISHMFRDFKTKVRTYREAGHTEIPKLDVLAFGDGDIRVIKLERRYENFYQVVFTYPTRMRR